MSEHKVNELFGAYRVESYSFNPKSHCVKFTLDMGEVELSELKQLEDIFGTDEIDFFIKVEEMASITGAEWSESRVEVFVRLP